MTNANYNSGRAFEYRRKNFYEGEGHLVIRASGSHGAFDLIAIPRNGAKILAIQCKRCSTEAIAQRLLKEFKENPPLKKSPHLEQVMEVYVKKTREVLSATV